MLQMFVVVTLWYSIICTFVYTVSREQRDAAAASSEARSMVCIYLTPPDVAFRRLPSSELLSFRWKRTSSSAKLLLVYNLCLGRLGTACLALCCSGFGRCQAFCLKDFVGRCMILSSSRFLHARFEDKKKSCHLTIILL